MEVIRDMPCEEDFERWDTNVRKDFLRKWYHTRSKRVQTVSLEECMEDEDSRIHSIPDPKGDFTEQVESEDFCQRLLREKKVVTVPGTAFGASGEGYIRCSYATGIAKLTEALDRMADFVASL